MKKNLFLFSMCLLALWACEKVVQPSSEPGSSVIEGTEQQKTWGYANVFAKNTMNLYYLWQKEIASSLDSWKSTEDPVEKVRKVRYKDDRWTEMIQDFSAFQSSVAGTEKTYGFDFVLYPLDNPLTTLCAAVKFTYEDSPARKAGLKRGDVIMKVNGKSIPYPNYSGIVFDELLGGDKLTVELKDGRTLTMDSVEMYENPVLLSKVFTAGDKKIGYLHFTSFTLDACNELVEVFREFKQEGVSELIMDLRYNGGGYVLTEEVLASLIGPEEEVLAGSVLSTMVCNEGLSEYFKKQGTDTNTYFKTEFSFTGNGQKQTLSTKGANPGIQKMYVIMTASTASASEALVCDLNPYMPISLIGKKTHGKFCTGIMMEAEEFFDDYADQLGKTVSEQGKKYTKNWGLYIMYARFADKNGQTLCMPDGLHPDYEAEDDPLDGFQLGDPSETMLARALALCGYQADTKAIAAPSKRPERIPLPLKDKAYRILLPEQMPGI